MYQPSKEEKALALWNLMDELEEKNLKWTIEQNLYPNGEAYYIGFLICKTKDKIFNIEGSECYTRHAALNSAYEKLQSKLKNLYGVKS